MARARVLVVGGGFAGFYAARQLSRAKGVDVTLVDRKNHHLFQPLLYQVASAVLSPGEIATPLRTAFRHAASVNTVMADVHAIDLEHHRVETESGPLGYDFLILATGSETGYGPHPGWAAAAPGLKTIDDALTIRQRLLLTFEAAARTEDPTRRRERLAFAIVGGGPTGVELAGAFAEIATLTLVGDFHRADLRRDVSITLVERADRLLASFAPEVSAYARRVLEGMGVRVMTGTSVEDVNAAGIVTDRGRVPAALVVWAAGVKPSPLAGGLPVAKDDRGRVAVAPDLSLPGHPEVFVAGDLAAVRGRDGSFLPALAPVAMQEGREAARNVERILAGLPTRPFAYRDRGAMAALGRSRAVGRIGRHSFVGRLAWLAWLVVHIRSLSGFENRLLVLLRWVWAYVFSQRGARLIYGSLHMEGGIAAEASPRGPEIPADVPAIPASGDGDAGTPAEGESGRHVAPVTGSRNL